MSTPPGFNRTGYFACFVSVSIRSLAGDHDAILPEGPPGQPSDMGYRNATLSATACTPQLLRSYSGEGDRAISARNGRALRPRRAV